MDFGAVLHKAQKNEANKREVRYYSTKYEPPKKEIRNKSQMSVNIQKFLARKEAEEKKKFKDAQKKKEELLSLRAKDKKATRRVNVMLKRTKSANQSVLEDAVDNNNTAVTLAGFAQPDEDDYGYVSQEASAFYNKMMEKYSKMPEEQKFPTMAKKISTNLTSTKDRVKAALDKEQEEAMMPRSRKRKHKESEEVCETNNYREDYEEHQEKRKIVKPKVTAPPPMNFNDLLKIAERKQFEPIIVEKKEKEEERLLTKRQKLEQQREEERKKRRQETESGTTSTNKFSNNNTTNNNPMSEPGAFNRIPKLNSNDKISKLSNGEKIPKINGTNDDKFKKPYNSQQLTSRDKKDLPNNGSSKKSYDLNNKNYPSSSANGQRDQKRPLEPKVPGKSSNNSYNDGNSSKLHQALTKAPSGAPSSKIRNGDIPIKSSTSKSDLKFEEKYSKNVNFNSKPPPTKKYLPGDIRAKQSSPNDLKPKQSSDVKPKQFPQNDIRPKQFPPNDLKSKQFSSSDLRPKQFPPSDLRPKQFPPGEVRRKQLKKKPMVHKGKILDDDSEYDSEMDDFIDDGPEEEEDYSKHIKEIFGYDKGRYREEDYDDHMMESNFAQQMREEVFSTKVGILEDMEELRKEEEHKKKKIQMKNRYK